MITPTRSVMGVYNGTVRIGEVEDLGRGCVLAFRGSGEKRIPLGRFSDRKNAMCAVSEAYRRDQTASHGFEGPEAP